MRALGLIFVVACAQAPPREAVLRDVTARMGTTRESIATCYLAALQRNRLLSGTMLVTFTLAPGTGAFTEVRVAKSELRDLELEKCVVARVGQLRLATPVTIEIPVEYPIVFTPITP